jgi:endonuclease/exonuclease/phosphatase family metal-dependent hydrolase
VVTPGQSDGGSPAGAAVLRCATFNIRNGRAWDGRHSWPLRATACAAAIHDLDADLVGLQEVRGFQQGSLRRRLPGYGVAGAGRDDGRRRGERCTVLYRRSRLRLERWAVRWFSDTPGRPGSRGWGDRIPRIVTLCRFHDLLTGAAFGLANAHWDGSSAEARERSAALLLGWLDPSLPWIVTGDLNATVRDGGVQRLLAAGLQDPLARLGAGGPAASTENGWGKAMDGRRIDFVLATPHWRVRDGAIARARPGERLPSDHWPVVATLELRDGGAAGPAAGPPHEPGRG